MSRTLFLSAVASAAILAAPVVAQTPASTQDFLNKAVPSNQFEIESSELALERADDDDVRAFAERMIEDHTTAAEQLQLAVSEDESVEMPPATLDEKHQALVDELSRRCRRNMPSQVRIATVYYKPASNRTTLEPDFHVRVTSEWLVFPHELKGLTREEILRNKPVDEGFFDP